MSIDLSKHLQRTYGFAEAERGYWLLSEATAEQHFPASHHTLYFFPDDATCYLTDAAASRFTDCDLIRVPKNSADIKIPRKVGLVTAASTAFTPFVATDSAQCFSTAVHVGWPPKGYYGSHAVWTSTGTKTMDEMRAISEKHKPGWVPRSVTPREWLTDRVEEISAMGRLA